MNKNKKPVLQIYQLVEHHAPYGNNFQSVVYDIQDTPFGYQYLLVTLDTKKFMTTENPNPLRNKFGIGAYYDDVNLKLLAKNLTDKLVEEAKELQNQIDTAANQAKEAKSKLEEVGRENLEKLLPQDVPGLIIAELRQNKSDSMEDYSGHKSIRRVIIGISKHKKNDFNEMRKCAANLPETMHLVDKNPALENRENYTGGGGYYLGEHRHSGWIIYKQQYYTRDGFISYYAEDAAKEDGIALAPEQKVKKKEESKPVDSSNLSFEMVDYSEKSFALFGDTYPIKDKLEELGGSFNYNLKYGNNKRPGYIFSKKKEEKVRKELNL